MSAPRRKLWLVGLSHHTAPVEVRERLAYENGTAAAALQRLLGEAGVEEGALLSTCNRVEIVACGDLGQGGPQVLGAFLARDRGLASADLQRYLYTHEDREAVRHLFRVAASLDSMVVGEPQILGQIKDCYETAAQAGAAGSILHRVFHKTFSVAKRVRSETGIGARNVSISSVAVDLAAQIFESLTEKTVMVIGAGKMAEVTARHLQSRGVGSMIFANRTFDRAVELARDHRGTPVPFDDLARYLPLADVVIGSTAATDFLLSPERLVDVLRERAQRPVFLIDLGVPRNFDPRINDLPNVYLYDVDDLERVLEGNLEERRGEALRGEEIVQGEVESFWRWFQSLEVVPTIVGLRGKAERICRSELERTFQARPQLADADRRAISAMAEAIVNKLLHDPIARLKSSDVAEAADLAALRRLFGLDDDDGGGGHRGPGDGG